MNFLLLHFSPLLGGFLDRRLRLGKRNSFLLLLCLIIFPGHYKIFLESEDCFTSETTLLYIFVHFNAGWLVGSEQAFSILPFHSSKERQYRRTYIPS